MYVSILDCSMKNYIDVDEEQFKNICKKFTNKKIFKKDVNGNLMHDNKGSLIKINYDNIEK